MKFLVVGCGLTGAVISRHLADAGHCITIIDQRSHIAGNCHTERDRNTGIMEHVYGPHISSTLAMKWYGNISINMVKCSLM